MGVQGKAALEATDLAVATWHGAHGGAGSLVPSRRRRLASGWWLLPSVLAGAVVWLLVIRAIIGWLG